MINLAALKIIGLLGFCIYASIDDIKRGIISNNVIIPSILIGLILSITECFIFPDCIIPQVLAIGLASAVSFALYLTRIWAGGDSKMMIAVSLLVPCGACANAFGEVIPCIVILSVSFALGYIYLLFDSLFIYREQNDKRDDHGKNSSFLKGVFKGWIACYVYVSLLFLVISLIFDPPFMNNRPFMILLGYLLAMIISGFRVLRNPIIIAISCAVLIALFLGFNIDFDLSYRIIAGVIVIVAVFVRTFVDKFNYQDIEVEDLKAGMILSLASSAMFSESRIKNLPSLSTEDLRSRLSLEEVNAVKKWCMKTNIGRITIVRKIPFAIFISLGSMVYLLGGLIV